MKFWLQQMRFPRSQRKRIQRKWAKDPRNWVIFRSPPTADDLAQERRFIEAVTTFMAKKGWNE